MDSRKLNDTIQLITSIAIVLGFAVVVWELMQNRETAKSQLSSDGWAQIGQQNASVVGEELAHVIAKACEAPAELTTADLVVLEAHIEDRVNAVWRIYALARRGSLYDQADMRRNVGLLNRVLSTDAGRAYWQNMSWVPPEIRAAVEEFLPSIAPCDRFFDEWKRTVGAPIATAEAP